MSYVNQPVQNVKRSTEQHYIQFYPPDFPITKIAAGVTPPDPSYSMIRKNSHIFAFEYIDSGEGIIQHDDMYFQAKQGDLFILHPHSTHRLCTNKKTPWSKSWFYIEGNIEYVANLIKVFGLSDLIHIPGINNPIMIHDIVNLMKEKSYIPIKTIASLVHFHLLGLMEYKQAKKYSYPEQIKMYIDSRIDGIVNIEDMTEYIGIGKSQLIKLFSNEYKITPIAYLITARIERAKELLLLPDYTIPKVASTLSFSSREYFSKVFKKRTGLSPGEYVQLNKNKQ